MISCRTTLVQVRSQLIKQLFGSGQHRLRIAESGRNFRGDSFIIMFPQLCREGETSTLDSQLCVVPKLAMPSTIH